jgi:hypothetical protein
LRRKIAEVKLKPVKEPKRHRLPGEPDLEPLFPILYLTPRSICPHRGPLRRGTRFVCVVCYQSGMDYLPALRRNVVTDPKPEPKPEPEQPPTLTRREKRALQRDWRTREATLTTDERAYLKALGVAL